MASNDTTSWRSNVSTGGNNSCWERIPFEWNFVTVMTSIIQPLVCLLGIIGNIFVLYVLTRHHVRKNVAKQEKVVHYGFFAMVMSDMLFCICALPRAFIGEHSLILPTGSFAFFYQLNSTGLITTFCLVSTWLIVITAALRYITICHPTRAPVMITHQFITIALVLVVTICILVNLPSFWLMKAAPLGKGCYYMDLGPFSHNTAKGVAFHWVRAIFAIFFPAALLCYFNTRIIFALRKKSTKIYKGPNELTESDSNEREAHRKYARQYLTRMLIAVVIMFILLVYPSELMDFVAHLTPYSHVAHFEAFIHARVFANLLQICNFAFNFVLYLIMNEAFRETLATLFRRGSRHQEAETVAIETSMLGTKAARESLGSDGHNALLNEDT